MYNYQWSPTCVILDIWIGTFSEKFLDMNKVSLKENRKCKNNKHEMWKKVIVLECLRAMSSSHLLLSYCTTLASSGLSYLAIISMYTNLEIGEKESVNENSQTRIIPFFLYQLVTTQTNVRKDFERDCHQWGNPVYLQ